jgi:hypothetical protein
MTLPWGSFDSFYGVDTTSLSPGRKNPVTWRGCHSEGFAAALERGWPESRADR